MRGSMLILVAATLPFPAIAQVAQIKPGAVQAIGPKQDDPLTCPTDGGAPGGKGVPIIVEGGRTAKAPIIVQGGIEAIGPKQDDPRAAGVLARPGDDEDPHAQGGGLAIGPKQDDPRTPGLLAIGPKQDDPRSPNLLARPGDDEDPQALAGKCGVAAP